MCVTFTCIYIWFISLFNELLAPAASLRVQMMVLVYPFNCSDGEPVNENGDGIVFSEVSIELLQQELFLYMDAQVRCWGTLKRIFFFSGLISLEGGGLVWFHGKVSFLFF